jgi:hypothetical protein
VTRRVGERRRALAHHSPTGASRYLDEHPTHFLDAGDTDWIARAQPVARDAYPRHFLGARATHRRSCTGRGPYPSAALPSRMPR